MSQSFVSGSGQQHVHAEQFAVRLHLASSRHSRIKSVTVSRSQPGQDACRKRQKACVLCAASNGSQASSPAAGDNGVSSVLPQSQRPRPQYVPNRIDDPNYVRIFDTTLRDGEQSPGATLTSSEKLEIAKQLAKLKVDIIEAGFPVASPDDFDAVRRIAMDVGNTRDAAGYVPVICGLSRTKLRDVEVAWDAVRLAERPRVHTFLATSPIHMEYKLRMTEDQVVENAVAAVKHLRKLGCHDIEFSPEDASRSEPRFLCRVLSEVIKAGATTVNIPDTTGWALPHEFGNLISELRKNTEGAENVIFSAHCQNDLGLATANTLAAAEAGARQLECTINGIGERAGNTSLEEVVMAIALRGEGLMNGLWTGVQPIHIAPTSRMVQDYTGMAIQPHKAIVGANAFAHESGIHQDGMLKSRQTYEIMVPETIGLTRTDAAGIVLGKHSGRHALKTRLAQLNYTLTEEQVSDVFRRFKDVADKKKRISDEDLLALMADEVYQAQVIYELIDLQVMCGSLGMPTASVKMQGPDGVVRTASGMGTGPVDASYKAIDSLVNIPVELMDYSVQSVTEGIEALAITRISLRPTGKLASEGFTTNAQGRQSQRTFSGSGADEDIVVASARAYVSGLNKLVAFMKAPKISAAERELQKLQASKPLTERTPGNAVAV